jgi:two-component system, NarL family, invasion response regulator UvrY
MPARILVADDHAGVAERLRDDLVRAGHGVRVATSPADASVILREWQPDVAIFDIQFKGSDQTGFDLLQAVTACSPRTRVLMYSVHDDAFLQAAARAAGATGFLSKMSRSATILDAVAAVTDGLTWFLEPPQLASGGLTPRQLEIVRHLDSGMSEKEIADKLGLEEDTISFHVREAKRRTGARSLNALVGITNKRGWLLLPDPRGGGRREQP